MGGISVRRVTIILSAALMLIALVPASALARRHGHHHRGRHHARIERFGDVNGSWHGSDSADKAGMVKSFTDGVLTITLGDGSTASGAVNRDTELECMAPEQAQGEPGDGGDGGGDQSGDNNLSRDAQTVSSDGGGGSDDQGEDQSERDDANTCASANLTPGTVVHEAELRITSAGSVWQKVELGS
jgi:hypothetical protein